MYLSLLKKNVDCPMGQPNWNISSLKNLANNETQVKRKKEKVDIYGQEKVLKVPNNIDFCLLGPELS